MKWKEGLLLATRKSNTLTVREYARKNGITLQSVYRRIWQKQIKARRIYGRWLISADKIGIRHLATFARIRQTPRSTNRNRSTPAAAENHSTAATGGHCQAVWNLDESLVGN